MKIIPSALCIVFSVTVVVADPFGQDVCPRGFEFDGQQCYRHDMINALTKCPKGFALRKSGKDAECTQYIQADPTIECPEGSSLLKSDCVEQQTINPVLECPAGYTLSGKECITDDSVNPSITCPKGSTLKKDGSMCEVQKKIPPTLYCPKGTTNIKGRCLKEVTTPATLNCPKSYDFVKGKCIREQTTKVQTVCPPGYSLQGTDCVKTDVLKIDPSCPPNTYRDPTTGRCRGTDVLSEGYRCPSEDYKYDPDLDKCVIKLFADPTCPTDYVLNRQTIMCEYMKLADPLAVCADGTSPPCTRETLTDSVVICPDGYTTAPDGSCIRQLSTLPVDSCPDGFDQSPDNPNICIRNETMDAISTCPDDSIKKNSSPPNTIASLLNANKPPLQYSLDSKNNICRALDEEEPYQVCPPNYKPTAKQCEIIEEKYVQYSCPSSYQYSDRDGNCIRTLRQDPIETCPKGFDEQSEKKDNHPVCVKLLHSAPVRLCPIGYEMKGKKCEAMEITPAEKTCPPGYTLSGDECIKIVTAPPKEHKKTINNF